MIDSNNLRRLHAIQLSTLLPMILATVLAHRELPADVAEEAAALGRGVNLANALEAPREGDWGVTLADWHFREIADAGFDSVRIPIRWSAHASPRPPYTIDPKFFQRVDWAIQQALSAGLLVVVNMHHYEEIFVEPDAHAERFVELWRQIAEHYQEASPKVYFELLNEPHEALQGDRWNKLVRKTLPVVRDSNPHRPIILGGGNRNAFDKLEEIDPLDDDHIIYTFHYYLPFHFTHQGAPWVEGADAWLGTEWTGNDEEREAIRHDFDEVSQWAAKQSAAIYLGEFGVIWKAPKEDRARWAATVREEAERRGFSWAYWGFCSHDFGVYDERTREWDGALRKALVPGR